MAEVARGVDPYLRESRNILDAIRKRTPGISRDLLQKTAEVFRYDQPNRLSWTIVPVAMRDRRQERMAKHTSAHS